MLRKINLKNKNNVAYSTMINFAVGLFLSILIILFNFIRNGLTTYTYGLESLGLLTIILGILPYLSSSHNGITSVSFFNLYDSVYGTQLDKDNYHNINQKIANFKPQYFFFGSIYLFITIILAFSFPFFFNPEGTIKLENGADNIKWYESTIFILSNVVEIYSVYLIIPVSVILLFINKQSYIYNFINILLTILVNIIIIVLFVLVKNNVIDLKFIWINVIIFSLLGSKMIFLVLFLYPIRKKYFPWYKKMKPNSWKITKDNILAVCSQYFSQFSSDVFSIVFIIYASISVNNQVHNEFHHNGDHHVMSNEFSPSGVFSIYLMLITSSKEIVHCIIDAFIPSMAEHVITNNNKINQHFFHRYQVLTIFVTSYAISTFLLTVAFSNSLFLQENQFNIWLACGLCIPIFIESITSTYDHLLPIYGNFKRILKISIIKALMIVSLLAILGCSICFTNPHYVINGLYISIIVAWTITATVIYFLTRHYVIDHISYDKCLNIYKQTTLSFIYIGVLFVLGLVLFEVYQNEINHQVAELQAYIRIIIVVVVSIVNFFINFFNLYLFRRDDFKYYVSEIKQINKQLKQK